MKPMLAHCYYSCTKAVQGPSYRSAATEGYEDLGKTQKAEDTKDTSQNVKFKYRILCIIRP